MAKNMNQTDFFSPFLPNDNNNICPLFYGDYYSEKGKQRPSYLLLVNKVQTNVTQQF
jgi:hypothetical protein